MKREFRTYALCLALILAIPQTLPIENRVLDGKTGLGNLLEIDSETENLKERGMIIESALRNLGNNIGTIRAGLDGESAAFLSKNNKGFRALFVLNKKCKFSENK